MSFFKKERKGGKCGHGKTGNGIPGAQGEIINVKPLLNGAGPQAGYDQVVTRRSGANKK